LGSDNLFGIGFVYGCGCDVIFFVTVTTFWLPRFGYRVLVTAFWLPRFGRGAMHRASTKTPKNATKPTNQPTNQPTKK